MLDTVAAKAAWWACLPRFRGLVKFHDAGIGGGIFVAAATDRRGSWHTTGWIGSVTSRRAFEIVQSV